MKNASCSIDTCGCIWLYFVHYVYNRHGLSCGPRIVVKAPLLEVSLIKIRSIVSHQDQWKHNYRYISVLLLTWNNSLTLNLSFAPRHLICEVWRARSDCTYVQSDLALHTPPYAFINLCQQYLIRRHFTNLNQYSVQGIRPRKEDTELGNEKKTSNLAKR